MQTTLIESAIGCPAQLHIPCHLDQQPILNQNVRILGQSMPNSRHFGLWQKH